MLTHTAEKYAMPAIPRQIKKLRTLCFLVPNKNCITYRFKWMFGYDYNG